MENSERLVCKRTDGGVSIITTAEGVTKERGEQDAINQRLTDFRWVPLASIPIDRTFRDAWCDTTTELKVDMDKAKIIHMGRIRSMRDTKLAKLDINIMKAQEQDKTSEVDALKVEKQRLRDIPQTFDMASASTPEQLKALWPSDLEKHDIYK